MANVDPLVARHPEFADTVPDLRALTNPPPPRSSALGLLKQNATPLLLGAGFGAGLTLAVAALTYKKEPRFSLFAASRSTIVGGIIKIALMAAGRRVLRRAVARFAEVAGTTPA